MRRLILAELRISLIAAVSLAFILCGLYPLAVWAIAQGFFPYQANGSLILDYDFMMCIFGELQHELPEFNTYMTWYFKEQESNSIGSSSKAENVLSID